MTYITLYYLIWFASILWLIVFNVISRKVIRREIPLFTIFVRVLLYLLIEIVLMWIIGLILFYPFMMLALALWFGFSWPLFLFVLVYIWFNLIFVIPILLYFILGSMISYRIMRRGYENIVWRYDVYIIHWLPILFVWCFINIPLIVENLNQPDFDRVGLMSKWWIGQIILLWIILRFVLMFFFVKFPNFEKVW